MGIFLSYISFNSRLKSFTRFINNARKQTPKILSLAIACWTGPGWSETVSCHKAILARDFYNKPPVRIRFVCSDGDLLSPRWELVVRKLLARRRVDNVEVSHISMKSSTPEQILSGQDVVILLIRPKDPYLDDFLEYYAWAASDASEGRSIKVLKLTEGSPELEDVRRILDDGIDDIYTAFYLYLAVHVLPHRMHHSSPYRIQSNRIQ
jgi:hypothetical protein